MNDKDLKKILTELYRLDKTRPYTYNSNSVDSCGNSPKAGKRWKTPKEYIRDEWDKQGFDKQELFDMVEKKGDE